MAELAQTYVHLRPYELDAEGIDRLGSTAQERAVAAAREIYRGNVTIDIRLEEGSAKLWATVVGVLGILHLGYSVVAEYKAFKDGIVAICEDARKFGTFVGHYFVEDAAATPPQIYRVERRLKVPGQIKRVIAELEKLEEAKLSEAELVDKLRAVQQKLSLIEKELSPQEVAGLHQLLLHFEGVRPLKELPASRRRPSLPRVVIRPEQPELVSGKQLIPYTELLHLRHADVDVQSTEIKNLTFHRSVFVPTVDDEHGQTGKDSQPLLI